MTREPDATGGIYYLQCPECGERVKMGLPRRATVGAITPASGGGSGEPSPCDGSEYKRRSNRCSSGH